MTFLPKRLGWTHTGYAIDTTTRPTLRASLPAVEVVHLDSARLDDLLATAGLPRSDRELLDQLAGAMSHDGAAGFVVTTPEGLPLVAAARITGGPKTRDLVQRRLGPWVPWFGEREHLLAHVWVAAGADRHQLVAAVHALAHLDPPANLARTITLRSTRRRLQRSDKKLLAALAGAGFAPYIHCVAQVNWRRPWRRRVDWVGPPPPVRPSVSRQPGGQMSAQPLAPAALQITPEVT